MAQIAVAAGADAIGLVIGVPRSPRTLTLSQAATIAAGLPRRVMVVAVFQDPSVALIERWKGAWVQLHGNEDEELTGRVGRMKHVIKGFRFDPEQVLRFNDCRDVDILLSDGSSGPNVSSRYSGASGGTPGRSGRGWSAAGGSAVA